MSLIRVQKKLLMPLPRVWREALRFCYRDCLQDPNEKKITIEEIRNVFENVKWWSNKINMDKHYPKLGEDDEEVVQLGIIAQLLRDNEAGKLDENKVMFKSHNIDYKKYYRLPGSVSAKEFHKAKEMYDKYVRKNGEQEQTKGMPQ